MRCFLFLLLLSAPALGRAQAPGRAASVGVSVERSSHFYTTSDGFPVNARKYARLVSGTPYLLDSFAATRVVLMNGTAYDGVRVRLNLAENEVQYLDTKGAQMVSKAPLKLLQIRDTVAGSIRNMVPAEAMSAGAPYKGWYEELATGKVALYCLQEKKLLTQKPFNSASEEQWVETRNRYFLLKDGVYTEVKKWKDALPVFKEKEKEIEAFQRGPHQTGRSWEQVLRNAVEYYNRVSAGAAPAV